MTRQHSKEDKPDNGISDWGKGRTVQSLSEETDINKIMGKYRDTGIINHVNLQTPVYADFSNVQDYHTARNALLKAQEIFDSLPARVRARVENDPGKLIEFAENPDNAEELVELGLKNPITPRQEPASATEESSGTPDTEVPR